MKYEYVDQSDKGTILQLIKDQYPTLHKNYIKSLVAEYEWNLNNPPKAIDISEFNMPDELVNHLGKVIMPEDDRSYKERLNNIRNSIADSLKCNVIPPLDRHLRSHYERREEWMYNEAKNIAIRLGLDTNKEGK